MLNPRFAWMLLILLACGLQCFAAEAPKPHPMVYNFWDWQQTPKRDDYMVALLDMALKRTTEQYGPYQLIRKSPRYSTSRVRREIAQGTEVNIQGAPWRQLDKDEEAHMVRIDFSILKDLLGCRRLIIRKADLAKFKNIKTVDDLKSLTAGLGRSWADVAVFQYNQLPVNDEGNVNSLFSMLSNGRFDYYPLSVLEAETAIAGNTAYADQFTLAPDLFLYYPLPMVYYVNAKDPRLSARVKLGLELLEAEGAVDNLLYNHFSKELADLHNPKKHFFQMVNPNVPVELESKNLIPRLK